MKKIFCFLLIVITVMKIHAQNANTSLSNLATLTAVNVSLLPGVNNSINLGSSTKTWKIIYTGGSMYLDGKNFISNAGTYSTFAGSEAGILNTGTSNTGIGDSALHNNTTGYGNTAMGYLSLEKNSSGYNNTAFGDRALTSNTSGISNTATGYDALHKNTTAYYNTAMGSGALDSMATGICNTGIGFQSLNSNNVGNYNTADGESSLFTNTNGSYNTAYGDYGGNHFADGSYNTFLGPSDISGGETELSNGIGIGSSADVPYDNHAVVGFYLATSIGGYANWSNISDGRVKKNIRENVPGLAFINKLQPVTYTLDLDAIDKISPHQVKDKSGSVIPPSEEELMARKEKEQIVYSGFIAQDVEKAAQELNYDFSGVDVPQNDYSLYGLRYADFVVPLVKAAQELKQQNDEYDETISELQQQIDKLKSMVPDLQQSENKNAASAFDGLRLEQNIPNPFDEQTTIQCYLPSQISSAQILVSDLSGHVLKTVDVHGNGLQQVIIHSNELQAGAYQYSLVVNGKVISTKQMMLTK